MRHALTDQLAHDLAEQTASDEDEVDLSVGRQASDSTHPTKKNGPKEAAFYRQIRTDYTIVKLNPALSSKRLSKALPMALAGVSTPFFLGEVRLSFARQTAASPSILEVEP